MYDSIYIKEEDLFYSKLFNDFKHTNHISGTEVSQLFFKSGLCKDTLKKIWDLSSKRKQPNFNKDEFFVSCRYISLAQRGIPLNEDNFYNKQPILPHFQGIDPPLIEHGFDEKDKHKKKENLDDLFDFLKENNTDVRKSSVINTNTNNQDDFDFVEVTEDNIINNNQNMNNFEFNNFNELSANNATNLANQNITNLTEITFKDEKHQEVQNNFIKHEQDDLDFEEVHEDQNKITVEFNPQVPILINNENIVLGIEKENSNHIVEIKEGKTEVIKNEVRFDDFFNNKDLFNTGYNNFEHSIANQSQFNKPIIEVTGFYNDDIKIHQEQNNKPETIEIPEDSDFVEVEESQNEPKDQKYPAQSESNIIYTNHITLKKDEDFDFEEVVEETQLQQQEQPKVEYTIEGLLNDFIIHNPTQKKEEREKINSISTKDLPIEEKELTKIEILQRKGVNIAEDKISLNTDNILNHLNSAIDTSLDFIRNEIFPIYLSNKIIDNDNFEIVNENKKIKEFISKFFNLFEIYGNIKCLCKEFNICSKTNKYSHYLKELKPIKDQLINISLYQEQEVNSINEDNNIKEFCILCLQSFTDISKKCFIYGQYYHYLCINMWINTICTTPPFTE